MTNVLYKVACFLLVLQQADTSVRAEDTPQYDRDIAPLLKRHCVKCHGPTKKEGKLNLAAPGAIIKGGAEGAAVVPHDVAASLLWKRIDSDEMPPEQPLSADEKSLIRRWILAGTPGLKHSNDDVAGHWAFQRLPKTIRPPVSRKTPSSPLDEFIQKNLETDSLAISEEADRAKLIRRVSFDLTGLPPEPEAIAEFQSDLRPDAYERMVDRYLASPHFGERVGKLWLDAAGYADSNGYFNADSDRPLAYRYRDYVIRALNADLSFDEFVRQQIAGDEIAEITAKNGDTADLTMLLPAEARRRIGLLEATHYLRCGQDGTGESDGNEDEVRVDRYTVLETAMQNISTGLFGLTIQCAKCHDHKFEPLTQRDYYSFQAVLIPAFPPATWTTPNDRFVYAAMPGELDAWRANVAQADHEIQRLSAEVTKWVAEHRPRGTTLFKDDFNEALAAKWSSTAPGDDAPGGTEAVKLNSREAPGAIVINGSLHLFEGGIGGDKWLSTQQDFDWTPDVTGASIQVTFDLVDHHIGDSAPAERIGYLIALHDFNDNSATQGGNVLIDGHPSAGSAVFIDYPGADSRQTGIVGTTGYVPGRNYGIRVTNKGRGKYLLQHLVDWQVEEKTITLKEDDLPDGGFGFEFCCGRSFVVDNVCVESFTPTEQGDALGDFVKELKTQRASLDEAQKHRKALGSERPGRIAWTTDVVDAPEVHVLQRGDYKSPGELVGPSAFEILGKSSAESSMPVARGSGRRLQFANEITEPESPAAALLARVQTNRLWQHHFGRGLVQTTDNFGLSGSPPTHPELLNWLAHDFVRSNWSAKRVHRLIVQSAAYRQQSRADKPRLKLDPDSSRLSRFPVRRLDAEAIRDSLLVAAGDFDDRMFGPYVPTQRTGSGETIVPEDNPGAGRRSVYLQQKRTQVHTLLQVFDAPSIVFNSTRRARSTMPLQSLSLLNSEFVLKRSRNLANRLQREAASESDRIQRLFLITTGQAATGPHISSATRFLHDQTAEYREQAGGEQRAWEDLSQTLLIGNAALYVE
jgi:mono/diheme cytochrome c family protein